MIRTMAIVGIIPATMRTLGANEGAPIPKYPLGDVACAIGVFPTGIFRKLVSCEVCNVALSGFLPKSSTQSGQSSV